MQSNQEKEIKIIDFLHKYLKEMVKLGNERFGNNYTNEETLQKYVENKDNICKLAIDEENKKLIGFFLMYSTNISGLSKEFKITEAEIKNFVGDNEKICIAHSLVVQKASEKGGLGTQLVKKGLEKAQEKDFYSTWSPLWIRKNGKIPAKNIMKRNGFSFYKNVDRLWYDDKNYNCLDCEGPCECVAAIYYKILQ